MGKDGDEEGNGWGGPNERKAMTGGRKKKSQVEVEIEAEIGKAKKGDEDDGKRLKGARLDFSPLQQAFRWAPHRVLSQLEMVA